MTSQANNSKENSHPHLSIFIPTYNDETDLSACLKSIRLINYPKERAEIIICDNASEDKTVHMVAERFDEMKSEGWLNLRLVEWDRNEGSYIPYNLVLPYLSEKTQYILGLDADIELPPDAIQKLLSTARAYKAAVVGARSVYFDRPEITSHGAGFVNLWIGKHTEKNTDEPTECDYVIGCCWLLDKKIFERLGCFDPDYYINHWEVDYCLRAKKHGFQIIYEPRATIRHKIPPRGSLSGERLYYLYRNKLFVIKKNAPLPQKWVSLGLYLLLFFPKSLADSIIRNKGLDYEEIRVILRAMIDGWLNRVGRRT